MSDSDDRHHDRRWLKIGASLLVALVVLVVTGVIGFQYGLTIEDNIVNSTVSTTEAEASQLDPSSKVSTTKLPAQQTDPKLQAIVDKFVAGQTVPFGIYIKDLKTGKVAGYNQQTTFITASLYKFVVAHEIYRQIDSGQLSSSQATGGGESQSISSCLNLMVTISSNECGRALRARVDVSQPLPQLADYGMVGTNLSGDYPITTSYDIGQLYERIYDGTSLSPASRDAFLGLLKAQKINNRLPLGLPPGTVFAHKTGDLSGYFHDGGIVYSPKGDYIISVLSGPIGGESPAHSQKFGDLSKSVYDYIQTR